MKRIIGIIIFSLFTIQIIWAQSVLRLNCYVGRAMVENHKKHIITGGGDFLYQPNNHKLVFLLGALYGNGAVNKKSFTSQNVYLSILEYVDIQVGAGKQFKLFGEKQDGGVMVAASLNYRISTEDYRSDNKHSGGWSEGWVERKASTHPGVGLLLLYSLPLGKNFGMNLSVRSRIYTEFASPVTTYALGFSFKLCQIKQKQPSAVNHEQ